LAQRKNIGKELVPPFDGWDMTMQATMLEQAPARLSSMDASRVRWAIFVALAVLVSVASGWMLFSRVGTMEFSSDEPGWIASSYYYTELARSGETDWNKWFCRECEGFGRLNLHVGQYLFGIPLEMARDRSAPPFAAYYNVDYSYEENVRLGQVPPAAIMRQARKVAAFFGVLCCVTIFAIGFWTYNAWAGLVAAGLLMTNAVFLKVSSQAMTDSFYNFFLLSVCLTLVAMVKLWDRRARWFLICLAGVLTGLACSVKITGILVGAGFFLGVLLWCWVRQRTATRQAALSLAAFFAVSLFVVYVLDPFFWPSYSQKVWQEGAAFAHDVSTKKIVPWHRVELENAAFTYPELRNMTHPLEFPLLFGRWSHELHRHLERGWAGWNGPRLPILHKTLFTQSVPFAWRFHSPGYVGVMATLLAGCTLAGIYFLFRARMQDASYMVLLVVLLVNYLLIVLFMKLNWDRYYLPTTTAVYVIAGVGAYELVRRAIDSGKRRA
jgi:hypothetical protein